MGSKTYLDNAVLELIFNGTALPFAALTTLYVALHYADPGQGDQTVNEVAYGGYARVGLARTTGAWTINTGAYPYLVVPNSNIVFPASSGNDSPAAFWSVGTQASGAGGILYAGEIFPNITITNGIAPTLSVTSGIGTPTAYPITTTY